MKASTDEFGPKPNGWQQVAEATHGVITPGNAITVAGMLVAAHGAPRLDTWPGIAESGVGFAADLVDGPVSRKTGTSTKLGELLDATTDKIKLLVFLRKTWKQQLAPRSLLSAVAVQNTANAAITLYDQQMNDPPRVHPSTDGKRSMFLMQTGIGLNVIGTKLEKNHPRTAERLGKVGNAVGWIGVVRGAKATIGYARDAGLLRSREESQHFWAVVSGDKREE